MQDNKTNEREFINLFKVESKNLTEKLCNSDSKLLLAINEIMLNLRKMSKLPIELQVMLQLGIKAYFNVSRTLFYFSGRDEDEASIGSEQLKSLLDCAEDSSDLKILLYSITKFPQFINKGSEYLEAFTKYVALIYNQLHEYAEKYQEPMTYIYQEFLEDEKKTCSSNRKDPNSFFIGAYEKLFLESIEKKIIQKHHLFNHLKKIGLSNLKKKEQFTNIVKEEIIDADPEIPKLFKEVMALKRMGLLSQKAASKALKQNNIFTLRDVVEALNLKPEEKEISLQTANKTIDEKPKVKEKHKRRRSPPSELGQEQEQEEEKNFIGPFVYSNKEEIAKMEQEKLDQLKKQKEEELKKQKDLEEVNRVLSKQKTLEKETKNNQKTLGKEAKSRVFRKHQDKNKKHGSYPFTLYSSADNNNSYISEIKAIQTKEDLETESPLKIAEYPLHNKKWKDQSTINTTKILIASKEEEIKKKVMECLLQIYHCDKNPLETVREAWVLIKKLPDLYLKALFCDKTYGQLVSSLYKITKKELNDKVIEDLLNSFYSTTYPDKFMCPS